MIKTSVEFGGYDTRVIKSSLGQSCIVDLEGQEMAHIQITPPSPELFFMAQFHDIGLKVRQLRGFKGKDPRAVLTLVKKVYRQGEKDRLDAYLGWYAASSGSIIDNIGMHFKHIGEPEDSGNMGSIIPFAWVIKDGEGHGEDFLRFVNEDGYLPRERWVRDSGLSTLYPPDRYNLVALGKLLNLGIV